MLNPVWLETFRTLIDIGHFTQTAEALSMTQPGVSQHIRKLEDACGYPLLKRDTRHFVMTEQGRQIYEYACARKAEETKLMASLNADDPFSGVCNLACSGALAMHLYPSILTLQKAHPGLITQLEAAPNNRILEGIRSGSLDIGIVTRLPDPHLYDAESFGKEHLSLVLPVEYEGSQVTAALLNKIGLIKHPDVYHYLGLFLSACGDEELSKIKPDSITASGYVNQIGQILLPVTFGLGFTVLPHSAVKPLADARKVYVPVMPEPVFEPLYWIWQHQRNLPARFTTLFTSLKDA